MSAAVHYHGACVANGRSIQVDSAVIYHHDLRSSRSRSRWRRSRVGVRHASLHCASNWCDDRCSMNGRGLSQRCWRCSNQAEHRRGLCGLQVPRDIKHLAFCRLYRHPLTRSDPPAIVPIARPFLENRDLVLWWQFPHHWAREGRSCAPLPSPRWYTKPLSAPE